MDRNSDYSSDFVAGLNSNARNGGKASKVSLPFQANATSWKAFLTTRVLAMTSSPLLHRIDRAIQNNPHSIRSRIFLESAAGQVILRGKVESFYQKQMIQESLRNIEGIESIANLLEVEETVQAS